MPRYQRSDDERLRAFVERSGPELVDAIRKVFRGEPVTDQERALFDAWLQPRVEALVDRLVATKHRGGT